MERLLDLLNGDEFLENLILESYSLKQALERLDHVPVKVLFISENGKLKATLTDGDVRRAILNGASLDTLVSKIANYNPVYLYEDKETLALDKMKENKIGVIPVVNGKKEITKVYIKDSKIQRGKECKIDVPIVMMAGGLGTRLYPYTKVLPKPLIPIRDIPISERIIQSFQNLGCSEFYMIINYKKNMIKAYFTESDKNYRIHFFEEDRPLGTGGGIRLIKNEIHGTFILTNCDILILDDVKKMLDHHMEQKNRVTMVCSLKNYEIPYGIVKFDAGGEIKDFEEKPQMSFFVNTGYYILEPDIFDYVGEDECITMPDIIARMKEDHQKIGMYPIGENAWLDMGEMDTLDHMEKRIKEMDVF